MYNDSNYQREIQNANLVEQLYGEKKKIQEKYFSLLDDVKKFLEETERAVMQRNYQRM
jgi:hypothetical protein